MRKQIVKNVKSGKEGTLIERRIVNEAEIFMVKYANMRVPIAVKAENCIFVENIGSLTGEGSNLNKSVTARKNKDNTLQTKEAFRSENHPEPKEIGDFNPNEKIEIKEDLSHNLELINDGQCICQKFVCHGLVSRPEIECVQSNFETGAVIVRCCACGLEFDILGMRSYALLDALTIEITAFSSFIDLLKAPNYRPSLIISDDCHSILADAYDIAQRTICGSGRRTLRAVNKIVSSDDPPVKMEVDEVLVDGCKIESIPDPAPVRYGAVSLMHRENINILNIRHTDIKPHKLLAAVETVQDTLETLGNILGHKYLTEVLKLIRQDVSLKDFNIMLTDREQVEYEKLTGKTKPPVPPLPDNCDLEILRRAERHIECQIEGLVTFLQDYEELSPERKDERIQEAYFILAEQKRAAPGKQDGAEILQAA